MMSNQKIKSILTELDPFKCKFTGDEIEIGIQDAREVIPFINANIAIPPGTFTGDLLRTSITTVSRTIWLHSIILLVKRPFSKSAESITYQIATGDDRVIMEIDPQWMMTEGFHMEYIVDKTIDPSQSIDMICSSTQAFGEVLVKLVVY